MYWIKLTSVVVQMLMLVESAFSLQCYHCNYYQATSSDANIQTVLEILASEEPRNTQCANFPSYESNTIQTINCDSLDLEAYGTPLGGQPFTGWKCGKQTLTILLQNYDNDVQVSVPTTIRGCIPVQEDNPYDDVICYGMSEKTNPYVMAINQGLYFPEYTVGPARSSEDFHSVQGSVCLCDYDWCNVASRPSPATVVVVVFSVIISHLALC